MGGEKSDTRKPDAMHRDHPRVGGEKLIGAPPKPAPPGSPPRGRGKGKFDETKFINTGITPAWARKRHFCDSGFKGYGDHPRVGGEKLSNSTRNRSIMGSPPHRRGKGGTDRSGDLRHGFTPAQAGKSWNRHRPSRHSANHPRACGEKPNSRRMSSCRVGSPPRGRGKDIRNWSRENATEITPAWAGKSFPAGCPRSRSRDHPRVGGEKYLPKIYYNEDVGSPPRGRGKALGSMKNESRRGITPAWAGKSWPPGSPRPAGEDHPRVGGEKAYQASCPAAPRGSPPRGRGKDCSSLPKVRERRITPAWAGKSPALIRSAEGTGDHPRVGGEKGSTCTSQIIDTGSPPRGRGKVRVNIFIK